MSPNKDDASEKLYALLCKLTGLPPGTDGQVVVDAYVAQWDRRAAFVGLPPGTPVPDIVAVERSTRLAAALRASTPPPAVRVDGVMLLSRDEAKEMVLFGAQSRVDTRRIEATEAYHGRSLREALEGGLLQ